jgi:hypothetical protein
MANLPYKVDLLQPAQYRQEVALFRPRHVHYNNSAENAADKGSFECTKSPPQTLKNKAFFRN